MQLYQHKSGLVLRKGSTDHKTLAEIKREYTWMPVENKRVLDIGGCFGGYSCYAIIHGAKEVLCFEPEPQNYETIEINIARAQNQNMACKVRTINKALTWDKKEDISFYLSTSGKSFGNFSTSNYRGRKEIFVKTTTFKEVLDAFKPEVIKMDCEGQEFDLLREPLPDFVKYFTLEIHFNSPSNVKPSWYERAPDLIKIFKDWTIVKQPKITSTSWHTIGAWKR